MEKLGSLSHLFVTVFLHTFAGVMAIPAITDVTMAAVCPGRDECSLAIFLSGFQQAVTGLGALVMMPIIGNLSDKYGRKALLTLPMALDIIPLVILAYSRETKFFYAYYVLRTLTAMIGEAGVGCLAIAYLADNISESKRASAFGVLSGIMSGSFVCGTLSARFLSPALTFQVAAVASMLSTAYMRIFLKDMACNNGTLEQPFLKTGQDDSQPENTSASVKAIKNIPSPGDLLSLLKSSTTFSQAASVAFFSGLSEGGFLATITVQACLPHGQRNVFHSIPMSSPSPSMPQFRISALSHGQIHHRLVLLGSKDKIAGIIIKIKQAIGTKNLCNFSTFCGKRTTCFDSFKISSP